MKISPSIKNSLPYIKRQVGFTSLEQFINRCDELDIAYRDYQTQVFLSPKGRPLYFITMTVPASDEVIN